MLLLGAGPRALLLQIAHPSVAAGVDEHSDFRADPWRRLRGTLRSYLAIVYGSAAASRAEIRRLNALHRGITGPGYAARDPELSLWVHATLVDSTIVVNDAWLGPLERGRARGVLRGDAPDRPGVRHPRRRCCPRTSRPSRRTSRRCSRPDGPVRVGPLARELADDRSCGRHSPGCSARADAIGLPRSAYDWTLWPAIGLLPPSVREGYGLPWDARHRLVAELARQRAGEPGGRCSRPRSARCRRRSPRTAGSTSAARGNRDPEASARGPAASRRRAPRAGSGWSPGRSGWPPRSP